MAAITGSASLSLGVHWIQNFAIRPDPDPRRNGRILTCRIQPDPDTLDPARSGSDPDIPNSPDIWPDPDLDPVHPYLPHPTGASVLHNMQFTLHSLLHENRGRECQPQVKGWPVNRERRGSGHDCWWSLPMLQFAHFTSDRFPLTFLSKIEFQIWPLWMEQTNITRNWSDSTFELTEVDSSGLNMQWVAVPDRFSPRSHHSRLCLENSVRSRDLHPPTTLLMSPTQTDTTDIEISADKYTHGQWTDKASFYFLLKMPDSFGNFGATWQYSSRFPPWASGPKLHSD